MGQRVGAEKRAESEEAKPRHPLLERLEAKRKELGLSMEKFAVMELGVTFQTYYRWLRKRFNPKLETLERIERVLDEDEAKDEKKEGGGRDGAQGQRPSEKADPS